MIWHGGFEVWLEFEYYLDYFLWKKNVFSDLRTTQDNLR